MMQAEAVFETLNVKSVFKEENARENVIAYKWL
jgi:hypothetical protein